MIAPKWLVLGVVLVAFALIASYDRDFGIAAGAVLGVIAFPIVWMRVRLWLADHEPGSTRKALVERFRKRSENRRRARAKELSGEN